MSFEIAKGLPAAIIAAMVALFVGGISLRQYNVAKAKFKLDLFDKRFQVYRAARDLVNKVVLANAGGDLLREINGVVQPDTFGSARFLFSQEINKYVTEIWNSATQVWLIDLRAASNGDTVRPEDLAEREALIRWFVEQPGFCEQKFAPFLDFGTWR